MKRPNGQGSVFYDKKRERYTGSFVTPEGKRVTKRFRTEKQAEEWLEDNRFRIRHNTFVSPSSIKLGAWLIQYVELYKPDIRPQTLQNYINFMKRLKPLASIQLQKLTATDIQLIIQKWQKELGASSISGILIFLNAALKKAVALDLITKNPMAAVERPRMYKKEVQVFTLGEIQKLLDHTEGNLHYIILTAVYTGCRIGEILALRWRDVYPSYISISKTAVSLRGVQLAQKMTKTPASRRKITIPENFYDALMEWKAQSYDRSGFVFHTFSTGRMMRRGQVGQQFKEAQEKAGISPIRVFHCLRHTHASQLLANGVPIAEVAKRLGHASPAVTLSVYTQWIPGGDIKVARDVEKIFSPKAVDT